MDFLSDETVRQYIFDFVFIVGTAILLQVCILKLVRQAMANEDDDIGTMFDLLSVTHSLCERRTTRVCDHLLRRDADCNLDLESL